MKPGYRWRVLAHPKKGKSLALEFDGREGVCFDELVVDDWLHVEQMDTRRWWMSLGGIHLWVSVATDGSFGVTHEGKPLTDYGLRADS